MPLCHLVTPNLNYVNNSVSPPPVFQTHSGHRRRGTGNEQLLCFHWIEDLWLVSHAAKLPSHPRCAWWWLWMLQLFQRGSHLENMFEAFPTWTPLMETSATVSSPSQSSSILSASRWDLRRRKLPVYLQSSSPTHLLAVKTYNHCPQNMRFFMMPFCLFFRSSLQSFTKSDWEYWNNTPVFDIIEPVVQFLTKNTGLVCIN